ncbi:c-type cytochrome [Alphaproteobacteria bacterium]|nr:c-type cytochrome [Alphaproteobacteria bacterium]
MRFFFLLLNIFFLITNFSLSRSDLNTEEIKKVNKVIKSATKFDKAERSESLSGGAGTVDKVGKNAFSHHFTTLNFKDKQNFLIGNGFFRKLWIAAPSSTISSDGLGPLYNARACQSCHIKDGKGHLPNTEKPLSLVIKTGKYYKLNLIPDKVYGKQFQFFSVPGMKAEVEGKIVKNNFITKLGKNLKLNNKHIYFDIKDLAFGQLEKDNSLSLRISPHVYGVGLLEAIEEEDILKKADKFDKDNDGISGVARIVKNENGQDRVGRFGIRASTPNLLMQSGIAFMHDMGISNNIGDNPYGDCTKKQEECFKFITGINKDENTEVRKEILEKVVFYLSSLSPPKRRNVNDKEVLKGKEIFYKSNCTSCHTPKYVTSKNAKFDFLKFQLIWPYTDLLLHDMGEILADKNLRGEITNREWKTPPLWGIGLAKSVNPRASFLHDGRAETILQAVLMHGGEAEDSINYLLKNHENELEKLTKFLESL